MQEHLPGMEAFVRLARQSTSSVLKMNGDAFFETPLFADSNFFSFFSFPLVAGRSEEPLGQPNAAVVTEDVAIRYFGTRNVLGKALSLRINDSLNTFYITAVAKNPPRRSSIAFGIVLSMEFFERNIASKRFEWINPQVVTYVKLAPHVSAESLLPRLRDIESQHVDGQLREAAKFIGHRLHEQYDLQPFADVHLNASVNQWTIPMPKGASNYWYSYTLVAIALLILLMACANFVNISMADSMRRSKEIGVRRVMGSSRKQLVYQFIGEAFLPCALALVVAIGACYLLLPVFNQLTGKELALLSDLVKPSAILFVLGIVLFSAVLVGLYPALIVATSSTVDMMNGKMKGLRRNYLARFLLVFQFALTILLMAGTLTIQSQFNFLTTKDLGYNEENLLKIQLPPGGPKSMSESFRDQLQSRPQIISVSGSSGAFESGYFDNVQTGNKHANAIGAAIDELFLPTMGIQLSKGENFHSGALNEGILINETLANALGLDDPIGETVSLASARESTKIIGVMKDFNYWPLQADVKPLFYYYQGGSQRELWIRAASGKLSEAIPVIAEVYKKLVDDYPFTYQVLEESNYRAYSQEAGWKQILAYGSAIAIFISGIGLFSFTAVSVVKRTKEIGMRKILGASGFSIVALFVGDFFPMLCFSIVLSVPVACLCAGKWLQSFANRISLEWWLFIVPSIIAIAIATLTITAYTALSLRNPVEALRKE